MNNQLKQLIDEKTCETLSNKDEILHLAASLEQIESISDFTIGIVVGRLYNSFYYQSRRLLGRNPTHQEFVEFIDMLNEKFDIIKSVIGK